MTSWKPDVRTLHRYLALRRDGELGATLQAIEGILPILDEPVRAQTMAILVAVPAHHCTTLARELLGVRRHGARVYWHRLIELSHLALSQGPALARAQTPDAAPPLRLVSSA